MNLSVGLERSFPVNMGKRRKSWADIRRWNVIIEKSCSFFSLILYNVS